jgi:hypothetical protein
LDYVFPPAGRIFDTIVCYSLQDDFIDYAIKNPYLFLLLQGFDVAHLYSTNTDSLRPQVRSALINKFGKRLFGFQLPGISIYDLLHAMLDTNAVLIYHRWNCNMCGQTLCEQNKTHSLLSLRPSDLKKAATEDIRTYRGISFMGTKKWLQYAMTSKKKYQSCACRTYVSKKIILLSLQSLT